MTGTKTNTSRLGKLNLVQQLAGVGLLFWIISLVAPTIDDIRGFELAYISLAGGVEYFFGGTWAALANFALLWASTRLMTGKPAKTPVVLMASAAFTSPLFWGLLIETTFKGWGVWAWTAAIVVIIVSWWAQLSRKERVSRNKD